MVWFFSPYWVERSDICSWASGRMKDWYGPTLNHSGALAGLRKVVHKFIGPDVHNQDLQGVIWSKASMFLYFDSSPILKYLRDFENKVQVPLGLLAKTPSQTLHSIYSIFIIQRIIILNHFSLNLFPLSSKGLGLTCRLQSRNVSTLAIPSETLKSNKGLHDSEREKSSVYLAIIFECEWYHFHFKWTTQIFLGKNLFIYLYSQWGQAL